MYSMFSFGKTITSSGKEGLHNGKLSKHITLDISTMYMKVLKKKWHAFFSRFTYWIIEFLINVSQGMLRMFIGYIVVYCTIIN